MSSWLSVCAILSLLFVLFSRLVFGTGCGIQLYGFLVIFIEPGHEKTCLMSYANNKGADQPAHPRSLTSAFIVRCLHSVMSLVSVTKISSPMVASVAEQASLSLTWLETPEDTFSHVVAHLLFHLFSFRIPFTTLEPTRNKQYVCVASE